jgi:hypothetical protein
VCGYLRMKRLLLAAIDDRLEERRNSVGGRQYASVPVFSRVEGVDNRSCASHSVSGSAPVGTRFGPSASQANADPGGVRRGSRLYSEAI